MNDFNEFYKSLNDYYIPYNTQLLILKSSTNAEDNYSIEEFYYPSAVIHSWFERHFGIWEKDKGLEIFERDMYKRRIDMNETVLGGIQLVGPSILKQKY